MAVSGADHPKFSAARPQTAKQSWVAASAQQVSWWSGFVLTYYENAPGKAVGFCAACMQTDALNIHLGILKFKKNGPIARPHRAA